MSTNISLDIPEYSQSTGLKFKWDVGFKIKVELIADLVTITANKEGLTSLARHLLSLAQDDVPSGHHIHLDEYNSLEDSSIELVITKSNSD